MNNKLIQIQIQLLRGDEVVFLVFASGSEVEDQFSFFGFGLRS